MSDRSSGRPGGVAAGAPRTLGPVSDLERHLPADWWRTLFDALYLKTDGDVFENDELTRADVDRVVEVASLEPQDRILDLCCGQGRHALELSRRGFEKVEGLDRSRYLVRLARQRAKRAELPVTFREGDARQLRRSDTYDVVLCLGNSFGYFDREADDLELLRSVRRALSAGGRFVLDVTDGEWTKQHFEARSWQWADQQYLVCRERSLSASGDRLICREVVVDAEQGVVADQFFAERLYSPWDLEQMLAAAGFVDVVALPVSEAESATADAGMMARRLFFVARAPAQRVEARPPRLSKVTVLLGDPRLPDKVKRDGQYNEEDFETLEKLRAALSEIGGIDFRMLDRHADLIPRLVDLEPEFVLNLCDEGLHNDATKELHVPAILEALGIPYTGAGPAALGLCYDKGLVRAIAADLDVPVPAETLTLPGDSSATLPSWFPALLKPVTGDSSEGITRESVVTTPHEMMETFERLRRQFPERGIIVQEFLPGAEYSVGLVGNPGLGFDVLPLLEVDYSDLPEGCPPILGYESKWEPDSPYWNRLGYVRCRASSDKQRRMVDWSQRLFERLGCRDYARFDFREGADGVPRLLEVNPNPGWCWDGKLNLMAGFRDQSYSQLLRSILDAAVARWSQVPGVRLGRASTAGGASKVPGPAAKARSPVA